MSIEEDVDGKCLKVIAVTLPEAGHANPLMHIAKVLRHRGHAVWFASTQAFQTKVEGTCKQAGITYAPCGDDEAITKEAEEAKAAGLMATAYTLYNVLLRDGLRKLAAEVRPDVLVIDFMTRVGGYVGDELGVPVVVNIADPVVSMTLGLSPSPMLPYLLMLVGPFMFNLPRSECRKAFHMFSFMQEALYSRLCLVNSFWGFEKEVPVPPNIVYTGPPGPRIPEPLATTSMDSLNAWLEWVRSENLKVIYVTFGTMVTLADWQVQGLFRGLESISDCAVAWSLRQDQQAHLPVSASALPRRFFVHHWFPQPEVVRLPDVRLVMSHCGWNGFTEVVAAGKPLVAVPFMGDQLGTAKVAARLGLAEVVPQKRISEKRVASAVRKVLDGPSYLAKAAQLQEALLRSGGGALCADAVEALLRAGGGGFREPRRGPRCLRWMAPEDAVA